MNKIFIFLSKFRYIFAKISIMKVLVTGSNGQLGRSVEKSSSLYRNFQFIYTDIEELDITKLEEIRKFISESNPAAIINCAAYTAVDKAEQEPEKAYLINAAAPGLLAKAAAENNLLFIHISTDFIFGGKRDKPCKENDEPDPESVYAKTKLEGEEAVIANSTKAVILRTSWLYSEFGNNFVKTILRLANERDEINVVNDQTGAPTYATDLAETILKLIPRFADLPRGTEILHYSDEGVASWYDFAKEIVNLSGLECKVNPVSTDQYPLPAKRPQYSVLDKSKIKRKYDIHIPEWKESLAKCLKEIEEKT